MDNIDIKILRCLRENARMNASDIGVRINMSVSAVIERIKKLEIAILTDTALWVCIAIGLVLEVSFHEIFILLLPYPSRR